jgi:voltage-gated potassium channel
MYFYEGKYYGIIDGLYWVFSTVTTVGYGDIYFESYPGRLFSIVVMITGVLFFFGFFIPYVIIPWTEKRFLFVYPREIEGLNRHLVICGYNRFTKELCKNLEKLGIGYVVMEFDEPKVRSAINSGIKCVLTDGSLESFKRNGIEKAMAVVIAWEEVEKVVDSLFTLSDIDLKKYVIFGDPYYTRYFLHAGADKVFLPKSLIASGMARTLLGEVRTGKMNEILPGLFTVEAIMPFDTTVDEIEKRGIKAIVICKRGKLKFNPHRNEQIEKGSIALLAGEKHELERLIHENFDSGIRRRG